RRKNSGSRQPDHRHATGDPAITRRPMSMLDHAAVPSLLRHRCFVLFWCVRTFSTGANQMLAVAVGWQLYDLTSNPLDLGIVGLVQFIPLLAFTMVTGQVADR